MGAQSNQNSYPEELITEATVYNKHVLQYLLYIQFFYFFDQEVFQYRFSH